MVITCTKTYGRQWGGGGGGGDYIYFSDTDVPRENQRRAQSRSRFPHKLPTQIRGKSYML